MDQWTKIDDIMETPLHRLMDQGTEVNRMTESAVIQNYAAEMLARVNYELPGLDPALASLYALLALTRGTETTLEDVHDAWAIWTATTRGAHKSLLPFAELTPEVQELDREYMDGIHRAAQ